MTDSTSRQAGADPTHTHGARGTQCLASPDAERAHLHIPHLTVGIIVTTQLDLGLVHLLACTDRSQLASQTVFSGREA
jgi:hypothetical protein